VFQATGAIGHAIPSAELSLLGDLPSSSTVNVEENVLQQAFTSEQVADWL
jgi:hypothetical protein